MTSFVRMSLTVVRCSPSLTLLPPPPEPVRRLPRKTLRLLKLLSAFSREHPADLLARLLRDEAKRVLRWAPRKGGDNAHP
ncbi:MAG: hypothetical protein E5X86_26640 [Mesorhizobium sp.]|uniref:hypothetical protein n=1 Tax=Mesorhizobium sp. TaxID=1871066 RepID=UPI000FE9E9F9|nr:hypothetical protein [Mesorhizobium sp.]RWK94511.1 MAG: hypothetical protein EOR53_18040 [Mesorhizobium sp.]TIO14030.1 MAG: hypothetical protein E5X86_26640 [Mesorhizobium sp.]TIP24862.1 MAG: hypothetical protein E5X67_27195 [Mesorhizobium sp.]TIQ18923.1 MAG: hypothetical protein E5X51_23670 [Mesorhizobium sp.]